MTDKPKHKGPHHYAPCGEWRPKKPGTCPICPRDCPCDGKGLLA